MVVDHAASRRDQIARFDRQQIRISRPGSDQIDFSKVHALLLLPDRQMMKEMEAKKSKRTKKAKVLLFLFFLPFLLRLIFFD
jgi:hypothetical protein